jgi:hypothetical protein
LGFSHYECHTKFLIEKHYFCEVGFNIVYMDKKIDASDYLNFTPKPLISNLIRPGVGGLSLSMPINGFQLIFAKMNYESYVNETHSFNKISIAFNVAIFTRSADTVLMSNFANKIHVVIKGREKLFKKFNSCYICLKNSCNHNNVRESLFPILKSKRESANEIIHLLDKLEGTVDYWPVKEVFDYCHELYNNEDLIYGNLELDLNDLKVHVCKNCKGSAK